MQVVILLLFVAFTYTVDGQLGLNDFESSCYSDDECLHTHTCEHVGYMWPFKIPYGKCRCLLESSCLPQIVPQPVQPSSDLMQLLRLQQILSILRPLNPQNVRNCAPACPTTAKCTAVTQQNGDQADECVCLPAYSGNGSNCSPIQPETYTGCRERCHHD
uniref:EGF-like domain-containing protein n=1 Tax=Ciona savignyi TaxID=51511 RepID=H2Y8I2_CIOSA